jgi:hypothetical protein
MDEAWRSMRDRLSSPDTMRVAPVPQFRGGSGSTDVARKPPMISARPMPG